jgi:hypothetical protein
MNAAVRSAVRVGIADGHKMFAIYDGFEGFANGQVSLPGVLGMLKCYCIWGGHPPLTAPTKSRFLVVGLYQILI